MAELKEKQFSIEKEQSKEKLPKLEATFLYAPHWTSEDARLIKEEIGHTDVYCPEMIGYPEEEVELLNRISQGDSKAFQQLILATDDSWWKGVYEAIYNSKKIIQPIDIPEGQKIVSDYKESKIRNIRDVSFVHFASGNFEQAIKLMEDYLREWANYQKKREEVMLINLRKLPQEIVKRYPEFKEKEKLKVLASLGSAHAHLHYQMKKERIFSRTKFIRMSPIVPIEDELWKKVRFKSDFKLDKKLVARIFIEDFLFKYLENFEKDTSKVLKTARTIALKTDFNSIKEISKAMAEQDIDKFQRPNFVVKFLEKKGIENFQSNTAINMVF